MGSMVGEVFMASPVPRINPVRARDLAEHESRHVDQWAVCTIVGGIGLLPVLYLVDDTLYPGSENHFEQAAGLFDGAYPPPPVPPRGPQGWAIALWAGVLLLLARRRSAGRSGRLVRRRSDLDPGRCAVHTDRLEIAKLDITGNSEQGGVAGFACHFPSAPTRRHA